MNNKGQIPISIIVIVSKLDKLDWEKLTSLSWADELLVVLTEPTNQRLAKKVNLKYKILKFEQVVNFSETRNKALAIAKNKWVLFLDSDEWIVNSQLINWSDLINSHFVAWSFKRKDIFYGQILKNGEPGMSEVIRLFDKTKIRYVGIVHEVPKINGEVGQSSTTIMHHPHQSISAFWNKIIFYASLASSAKETNKPRTIFELLFFPVGKFIYNFVILLGFLDGWRGLVYALLMSFHSLFVRLYRLEKMYGN